MNQPSPALAIPSIDERKRAAAIAAVAEIRDGMLVGLGTGSTAHFAVEALGQAVARGLDVRAVATSRQTAMQAIGLGIVLLKPAKVARIDLCIDGVDEIDPAFRAIKGAGGAMLREKIVAGMAARRIAIADDSKAVEHLGTHPVPTEVLPHAQAFVTRKLREIGCKAVLRLDAKGAPVLTDQDNIILDCHMTAAVDWAELAGRMDAIPGLMGHGLFLEEIDALFLGTEQGVERRERAR